MKKRKIIIFAVELILCVGVYAQRQEVRSSSDTTRNMGERNIAGGRTCREMGVSNAWISVCCGHG